MKRIILLIGGGSRVPAILQAIDARLSFALPTKKSRLD